MFKAPLFNAVLSVLVISASSTNAQTPDLPKAMDMFNCGSFPVFEHYEDYNGGFVYRKNLIQWQQGHENAVVPMTMTTKLVGRDCSIQVKFANKTKSFKYRICDLAKEKDGDCDQLVNIQDMTPPLPSGGPRNCSIGPEHKHALANCKVPVPKTKREKKYIPPACRNTSTGTLIEPYTCKYISRPQKESFENYGAKLCTTRAVKELCTAKVKCDWNNSVPRNGHVLSYVSFVYCPSAGNCNMDPMTCGADREMYFEDPATVEEMLRTKYNVPKDQRSTK